MSKAATTEELATLHKQVAESLSADLTAIEAIEDPAVKARLRIEARAQAMTFLKNNNITAAQGNGELDKLKEALANKKKAAPSGISAQALDEAAELYGQRIQ